MGYKYSDNWLVSTMNLQVVEAFEALRDLASEVLDLGFGVLGFRVLGFRVLGFRVSGVGV